MNDKAELVREFLIACEDLYKPSTDMPPMVRNAWLFGFRDIHFDRLAEAMGQYLATGKFFPVPADIRELALTLAPSPNEIAERAEYARHCREKLERQIEAGKQRQEEFEKQQIAAPIQSHDLSESEIAKLVEKELKPAPLLGAGMTEAEWHAHLNREKEKAFAWAKERGIPIGEPKPIEPQTAEAPTVEKETPLLGPEGWVM